MCKTSRATARKRRFARLRATALPTFLEQVKPTRIEGSSSRRLRPCTIIAGVPWRLARAAARKSDRLRKTFKLSCAHDETAGGLFPGLRSGASGGVMVVTTCWRLRAQRLTATRTTCVQDLAAGFGGHARAEPVAAFANQVRGLKGAFHRSVSDVGATLQSESHTALMYPKPGL